MDLSTSMVVAVAIVLLALMHIGRNPRKPRDDAADKSQES